MLISDETSRKILKIVSLVLIDHFCFDQDSMERFYNFYLKRFYDHYFELKIEANEELKEILKDPNKLHEFTTEIISYHINKTLYHDLHFSEQDMMAFDTVMIKHILGE